MMLLALALSFAAYGALGDTSASSSTSSQRQIVAGTQTYTPDRISHTMSADARLLQINILQPANLCRRQCASGTPGEGCECSSLSRTGTLTWEGITVTALPTSGQVTTVTGSNGSAIVHTFTKAWTHTPASHAASGSASVTSSIETVIDNGTTITRTWTIPAVNISTLTSTIVTSTAPNGSTITKTFTLTPHGLTRTWTNSTATQPISTSTVTQDGKTITLTHTFFNTTTPEIDTVTTTDNSGKPTVITKTWTVGNRATNTHSVPVSSTNLSTSTLTSTDAAGHATTITKTFTIPASVTRTGATSHTTDSSGNQPLLGASEAN